MNKNENTLNTAPSSVRTHIGFFGRMNAGKSSLINALTKQEVSIVSPQPGTTTDVVRKPMEIHGIGPCILVDTAGFDDSGSLGEKRAQAARKASMSTDMAVVVLSGEETPDEWAMEKKWLEDFEKDRIPVIVVLTASDRRADDENEKILELISQRLGREAVTVSSVTGRGIEDFKNALITAAQKASALIPERMILGDLVKEKDTVLLVMPQDPQAPEGRLILPEVQTIRETLDRHCIAMCVQPGEMEDALSMLKSPPALVVCDSQVFDYVSERCPAGSSLTSFSVLFAAWKGDIGYYTRSVRKIDTLTENSKVLIAECCTHAPMDEDIGRVKIPALLRKKAGKGLQVDVTAGSDFPEDLASYDLVIQCGACMFNRRYVCARIDKAKEAGVPMTNYGITIAYLKGILDKVDY